MRESDLQRAMRAIREVLRGSPVPEDPGHAENTLQWLLKIRPDSDDALRLAALAHDIERARPGRLQRHQFKDYDSFKAAHARYGAWISYRLLRREGLAPPLCREVALLVRQHETGGNPRSDLIKDADSLSYFDHNIGFYFEREGWDETLRRARWGYRRLSPRAQRFYQQIQHQNASLDLLLRKASAC